MLEIESKFRPTRMLSVYNSPVAIYSKEIIKVYVSMLFQLSLKFLTNFKIQFFLNIYTVNGCIFIILQAFFSETDKQKTGSLC